MNVEGALTALEEALEPHKRGLKFRHSQKVREENIENLKEGINRLKRCLEEKEKLKPQHKRIIPNL